MTPKLAWDLFVELRKEVVETQKTRTQVAGFKITVVSGAFAFFLVNVQDMDIRLLAMPAFAAIFFDFLIISNAIRVKRIGEYLRVHVEPHLRENGQAQAGDLLWQEYMGRPEAKQAYSLVGHFGLTALVVLPGVFVLLTKEAVWYGVAAAIVLVLLFTLDLWAFFTPRRWVGRAASTSVANGGSAVEGTAGRGMGN